ncbi:MAG: caspase family protein [Fibrobacter sp.]|nr:caspase family protein [Fibrobacter sp.]
MFRTALLFIAFILLQSASAYRYALLIGQNDGGNKVEDLRFAEEDTRRFADVLVKLGGFERSNVITALRPDSSDLQNHLSRAARLLKSERDPQNSLFLLYYSGHADGQSLLLEETKYPIGKIESFLDSIPAGIRIGIFDACQSGAVAVYKGGTRAEPFFLRDQQKIKGQVIIASSAANERAQESQSLKSSVFSFHWLNGLRGSADFSADRKVTLNEAYQYAYRKTVETSALTSGEIQHPSYRFNISGQGDIMLTDLQNSSSGLIVEKECIGKFLVLSESYLDVYADFHKEDNRDVFISLPPGKYSVVNARGKDVGTYQFELNRNKTHQVLSSMFIPNTLTESRLKGGDFNPEESTEHPVPLTRFGWGPGFGLSLMPSEENEGWGRDLLLGLCGQYYLNNNADLFFDFYGLVSGKTVGADLGLDGSLNLDGGRIFAGAGCGFQYRIGDNVNSSEAAMPFLTAHMGFSADLSRQAQLQLRVPYSVSLNSRINHRVGIEFRVLFRGPYSDVGVLK